MITAVLCAIVRVCLLRSHPTFTSPTQKQWRHMTIKSEESKAFKVASMWCASIFHNCMIRFRQQMDDPVLNEEFLELLQEVIREAPPEEASPAPADDEDAAPDVDAGDTPVQRRNAVASRLHEAKCARAAAQAAAAAAE
jgi:hypothetical protein